MPAVIPIKKWKPARFARLPKAVGAFYDSAFELIEQGCYHPPLAKVIPLFGHASELSERIAVATKNARRDLHKLDNAQLKPMLRELRTAEKSVRQVVMDFDHDPRNITKAQRLANLKSLKVQIDLSIDNALANQTLLPAVQAGEGARSGVLHAVKDLHAQNAPGGWGSLTAKQAETVADAAFALVDNAALSFLSAYRIELAGVVADDIKNKIKSQLTMALLNGDPLYEVTRKLGQVITDPEKFRHAGGRIFPSAANRLQLIVHTENMRAHNQGRVAFYGQVGIFKVRWLAEGPNSCPACMELNEQIFTLEKLPAIPQHPNCACTIVGEASEVTKTPEDYGLS